MRSNLESQRRKYELVEVARGRGFTTVEAIDDDLGPSASGAAHAARRRSLGLTQLCSVIALLLLVDPKRLPDFGDPSGARIDS